MSDADFAQPVSRMIDVMDDREAFSSLCRHRWGEKWQTHAARFFGTYPVKIQRMIGLGPPPSLRIDVSDFYAVRDELVRHQNSVNDLLRFFDAFIAKKNDRDKAEAEQAERAKAEEAAKKAAAAMKQAEHTANIISFEKAAQNIIHEVAYKSKIYTRREIEMLLLLGEKANPNTSISNLDEIIAGSVEMLILDERHDDELGVSFYTFHDPDPNAKMKNKFHILPIVDLRFEWVVYWFYANGCPLVPSRMKNFGFISPRIPRWIMEPWHALEQSQLKDERSAKLWHTAAGGIDNRRIVESAIARFRKDDEEKSSV